MENAKNARFLFDFNCLYSLLLVQTLSPDSLLALFADNRRKSNIERRNVAGFIWNEDEKNNNNVEITNHLHEFLSFSNKE